MRLNERRRTSRFQRSLTDKYYNGQTKREAEVEKEEEMKKRIIKEEFRATKNVYQKQEFDPMGTIRRYAPIAVIAAIAYALISIYLL